MLDAIFQDQTRTVAKQMLDHAHQRQQALAANIANVETPGYKRLDVSPDFQSQLRQTLARGDLARLAALRPEVETDRTSLPVRPDGNNVQIDRELMEMSKNSLNYEFLTQMVSSSIKRLQTAITGRTG